MNFWKHKCLCNAINETNNMTRFVNHCVKHHFMLITVRMIFCHLVGFLPGGGLSVGWEIFWHMVCLLPEVGFLSVGRVPTTGGTSTISGFSAISGLSTISGFSDISRFSATWGAFCQEGLCHWWDFSGLAGSLTVGGFSALMKQTKKKSINKQSFGRCHSFSSSSNLTCKGYTVTGEGLVELTS